MAPKVEYLGPVESPKVEYLGPVPTLSLGDKAKNIGVSFLKGAVRELPTIGAIGGGTAGAALGLPIVPATMGGSVLAGGAAGSALGAGMGKSLQNMIEQAAGWSEPQSVWTMAGGIGEEMLLGGLTPPGGKAGSAVARFTIGSKLTPAMEKTAAIAKETGVVPSMTMLRPDSKTTRGIEWLVNKLPGGSLLQRNQYRNIVAKTGEFAEHTKDELLDKSIAVARKEQGQVYQAALEQLPERLSMPQTLEYVQKLVSPNMPPKVLDALNAFIQSADEAGTVSREMLGTLKSSIGSTKISKVAQKEIDRLVLSDMGAYSDDAARLWGEANKAYAYLGKLKTVENVFRSAFSTGKGYREFNPARYVDKYANAVEDGAIPSAMKPLMDKVNTLAKLSTESAKRKAEMNGVMDILSNALGVGGIVGGAATIGATPAIAIAVSSLALARSSTAKRGIIRKLATSNLVSKEAADVLGELAGKIGTMHLNKGE